MRRGKQWREVKVDRERRRRGDVKEGVVAGMVFSHIR